MSEPFSSFDGRGCPSENSPRGALLNPHPWDTHYQFSIKTLLSNLISRYLWECVIPHWQTHNQKLWLFTSLSKCVSEVFKHRTQNGWIIQMFGIQKGNPSNWNFRTVTQLFAPFTRKARVWMSSLKIDEIDKSISSIQALKSQKRDFRHFSGAKVCYSNRNVKFKNSMHIEWSEEKFWKGSVGDKTRLRVWNKHQKIQLVFTQLARYNWRHGRVLKYQKTIPEKLANKSNVSGHKVDI